MSDTEDSPDSEVPKGFRKVELSREPVDLFKILKFEGMVGSGGEAKAAIDSGLVLVDGEVETQKRKKIVSGNTIEFGAERIYLKLSPIVKEPIVKDPIAKEPVASPEPETKPAAKPAARKKPTRRKPIAVASRSGKKKPASKR